MCPDRNVLNCFAHYNGFVVVTVLICIVIIYVVYNSSASASDKRPAEGLSAGTEPNIQASNDHALAEQASSSAPSHGLSLFKLAALFSPVWAPPLLALLAPLLPGQGGAGLIVFTLFILPLWGSVAVLSLRSDTAFAFLVAIAYYAAAVVVTFFIGGIALLFTAQGLY